MKIFQIFHKAFHDYPQILKLNVIPLVNFLDKYKIMNARSGQGARYFVISPLC